MGQRWGIRRFRESLGLAVEVAHSGDRVGVQSQDSLGHTQHIFFGHGLDGLRVAEVSLRAEAVEGVEGNVRCSRRIALLLDGEASGEVSACPRQFVIAGRLGNDSF